MWPLSLLPTFLWLMVTTEPCPKARGGGNITTFSMDAKSHEKRCGHRQSETLGSIDESTTEINTIYLNFVPDGKHSMGGSHKSGLALPNF